MALSNQLGSPYYDYLRMQEAEPQQRYLIEMQKMGLLGNLYQRGVPASVLPSGDAHKNEDNLLVLLTGE